MGRVGYWPKGVVRDTDLTMETLTDAETVSKWLAWRARGVVIGYFGWPDPDLISDLVIAGWEVVGTYKKSRGSRPASYLIFCMRNAAKNILIHRQVMARGIDRATAHGREWFFAIGSSDPDSEASVNRVIRAVASQFGEQSTEYKLAETGWRLGIKEACHELGLTVGETRRAASRLKVWLGEQIPACHVSMYAVGRIKWRPQVDGELIHEW